MSFLVALQFLTRLPSPIRHEITVEEMGRSAAWFPAVGLLLGLILAALDLLLRLALPPAVVDVLLLVALLALTGALHMDGLMDTCDGIFSFKPPERRLEIMRDSRVGSFGVVGAASVLLVQFGALQSLPLGPYGGLEGTPLTQRAAALVLAPLLARWAMVYATVAFPLARASGLGAMLRQHTGRRELVLATLTALVVALAVGRLAGLAAFLVALTTTWLGARYVMTKIPGLTGDVYGAINEVVFAVVLLAWPLLLRVLPWLP